MDLILVRHADAEPGDGYAEDALRPLTKKGRKTQERVAMSLRKLGCTPDRIFTSPRVRAAETAEITAHVLGAAEPEELAVLDGGFELAALVTALEQRADGDTILCVGHEPDMSTWAGQLLAGPRGMAVRFKKSAVLGVRFAAAPAPGNGELLYFYRPKDLEILL